MTNVTGEIRVKWLALGGSSSFLGEPISDTLPCPDGIGWFTHFQGGSIFWTEETKAHAINGEIKKRWDAMDNERSFLRYPISDTLPCPDGIGWFTHFQGGSIFWTEETKAHAINGEIKKRWDAMDNERSFLRYPISDTLPCPDGIGWFTHFQGGSIFWTPDTHAHAINGEIKKRWDEMGNERSFLGYPTSDTLPSPDGIGWFTHFQGGTIFWTPATGAYVVSGDTKTRKWDADVRFPGSTPLGGSIEFVADNTGAFTFSGHMHDSGLDPISFTIVVAIVTASGMAYGFGFSGKCGGTIAGGSRDCDWLGTPTSIFKDQNSNVVPNPNPAIAANWEQIAQGKLTWRITAQDLTAQGISDFVTSAVEDLAKQAVAAGTAALIALL